MRPTELDAWLREAALPTESEELISGWPVPTDVRLERRGGKTLLRCRIDLTVTSESQPGADRSALRSLLALARLHVSDEEVRRFVLTHGPLSVGPDGLPVANVELDGCGWVNLAEDVEWYRRYAGLLAATLRLAESVRREDPIRAADVHFMWQYAEWMRPTNHPELETYFGQLGSLWRRIRETMPDARMAPALWGQVFGPRVVADTVNWWVRLRDVRPRLTWPRGATPTVRWTGLLWGAIGAQLIAAVQRAGKTAVCADCGREVPRKRAPKRGQQAWCGRRRCERARQREAQRKSRERRRNLLNRSRT